MVETEYCQVVTSVDSRAAADELAGGAVRARLAACAQVGGPVTSVYWWRGQIETAQEWQVLFKTTRIRYDALAEHIRSGHPYEVPEILCTPVVAGNPGYLDWLRAETRPAPEPPEPPD